MSFWECLTHNCGSMNFNNLVRHEMPLCDIKTRSGKHEPRTWHDSKIGGCNGDVSRKFYKEWDKLCVENQQKTQIRKQWKRQVEVHADYLEEKKRWWMNNDFKRSVS